MIKVKLKDGSIKEIQEHSSILELADLISKKLAKSAVVGEVNGTLKDLSYKLNDNDDVCLKCGVMVNKGTNNKVEDKPLVILNILSFLYPLVGLILYLSMKKSTPNRAKKCGKYALIGTIVSVVIFIIVGIILAITLNNVVNSEIAKYSDEINNKAIVMYEEENKKQYTCYNLYKLDNNSDYVGSVSIDKDGNDYIVKTYITKDNTYFRAEYKNKKRTSFNNIINNNPKINLYCVD